MRDPIYISLWKDSSGLPRAWGRSTDRKAAEIEADAQFEKYKKSKADVGGTYDQEPFERVTMLESGNAHLS